MLGRLKKQAKLPTATSKGLLNKIYLKDYPNNCIAVSKIKQSPKLKLIIHNTQCRKLGFKLSLDARSQIKLPLCPSKLFRHICNEETSIFPSNISCALCH